MSAFHPLRTLATHEIASTVQVEIYHDGKLIGRSNLDAADPPMGVAAGPFDPSAGYQRELHAREIEGVFNSSGAELGFVVQSEKAGVVDCLSVFIQDFSDGLGERQVSILGIPYPDYETLFSEYPAFKAYWGKS